MSGNEIVAELNNNNRWLTDEYKNSNYYKEYLKETFEALSKTYKTWN